MISTPAPSPKYVVAFAAFKASRAVIDAAALADHDADHDAAAAADAAAYAADAVAVAVAKRNQALGVCADIGLQALIALKSPGCEYLWLADEGTP